MTADMRPQDRESLLHIFQIPAAFIVTFRARDCALKSSFCRGNIGEHTCESRYASHRTKAGFIRFRNGENDFCMFVKKSSLKAASSPVQQPYKHPRSHTERSIRRQAGS